MAGYLLRGVLIGLLFGLPVGAVGTMTVQRTWSFGFKAGLLTGPGSSVADCLYAIVGAFGLTWISDFLLEYQTVINVLGGGLIPFMGLRLICKKSEVSVTQAKKTGGRNLAGMRRIHWGLSLMGNPVSRCPCHQKETRELKLPIYEQSIRRDSHPVWCSGIFENVRVKYEL